MITFKEYLKEMGDSPKGKESLARYIKARSHDVALTSAEDALVAGTNIKAGQTVYGLDPRTKEPITKKPKPKYKEEKKLIGIGRAVDRIMREETTNEDRRQTIIEAFVKYASEYLEIENLPNIEISENTARSKELKTYGLYQPANNNIWVYSKNRNMGDVLRTLAHEMTHHRQNEEGRLYEGAGAAGTDIENEANSKAAIMLRHFGAENTVIYEETLNNQTTSMEQQMQELDEVLDTSFYKKLFIAKVGEFITNPANPLTKKIKHNETAKRLFDTFANPKSLSKTH